MAKTLKKSKPQPAPYLGGNEAGFQQSFQMLLENPELVFQIFDLFPVPVNVFAADGTTLFSNRAFLELNNIPDASLVVGKYNLLNDPVCNDRMGWREGILKAFHGEPMVAYGVDADLLVQDIVNRGVIDEKPFEKSFMDFHLYPVMDGKKVAFVVLVCVVKKLYHGRPDLARAKAYIDSHWKEEFDPKALARSVSMSVSPLYKIFKEHTGMTPGDYYRKTR